MYSKSYVLLGLAAVSAARLAPRQTQAPSSTEAPAPEITAVTDCHPHETELYCFAGPSEYLVQTTLTDTDSYPEELTGCHAHETELYCFDPNGEEVLVHAEGGEEEEGHDHEGEEGHDHNEEEEEADASGSNRHCHDHAGVPHCVGGDPDEISCEAPNRDYNINLRVGLLFVILATSAIGVFSPILLQWVLPNKLHSFFVVLKQFGTGIIISTAFVHLYTHASLMFNNPCLGVLQYESTTSAIVMAGIFLSFLVEYVGQRVVIAKTKAASAAASSEKAKAVLSSEVMGILVMEVGIIFHSLLIGITLVVSGDDFFLTLFVVILFHQVFEGIALGSRIAAVGARSRASATNLAAAPISADSSNLDTHNDKSVNNGDGNPVSVPAADTDNTSSLSSGADAPAVNLVTLTFKKQLGLAALFGLITPIGMAIGIGTLDQFNGNDRSTIIAIGTLDALSAGILVWVGVVEMWAADWMLGGAAHGGAQAHAHADAKAQSAHGPHGELADADWLTVALAMFGLLAGLILMSLLGKWA